MLGMNSDISNSRNMGVRAVGLYSLGLVGGWYSGPRHGYNGNKPRILTAMPGIGAKRSKRSNPNGFVQQAGRS